MGLDVLIVVSCHLGGAGLVPRRFELVLDRFTNQTFQGTLHLWSGCWVVSNSCVLVTKARNVSDFHFRVLVTMSSRFALFKLQNLLSLRLLHSPRARYNDHYDEHEGYEAN